MTLRSSISEETLLFLAESGIASITSFAVPMTCLPFSTGVVAFFMFSENPATLLTALMPVNVCPYASLPSKRIAERKSAEDDEKPDIDSSLSAIVEFGSVILLMNSSPFSMRSMTLFAPGTALPTNMVSSLTPAFARSLRHGSSLFDTPPSQPSSNTQKLPPFIPGGMLTTCSTPRDGSGSGLPVRLRSTPGAATFGQLSSYTSWRETGTYRSPLHS